MRVLTVLLLALALAGVATTTAGAEMHGDHPSLERLVVESADTPKEHEALAAYYRDKAEHMRQMAAQHRSMGEAYMATKMMQTQRMQAHCKDLAGQFEKAAEEYAAMAQAHEDAAKP